MTKKERAQIEYAALSIKHDEPMRAYKELLKILGVDFIRPTFRVDGFTLKPGRTLKSAEADIRRLCKEVKPGKGWPA